MRLSLAVLIASAPLFCGAAEARKLPPAFDGRPVRITGSDGFFVSTEKAEIRLFGVDAPSRTEPGYDAAAATLTEVVTGKLLHIEPKYIDTWGRVYARVFLDDPEGPEVNQMMIERGPSTEDCAVSHNAYGTCERGRPPVAIGN